MADKLQANVDLTDWARFDPKRAITWDLRKEQGMQPFKSAVAEHYAYFDENNIPWTDSCRMYLLFDMKQAGLQEGTDEMMAKCRKTTEERLQAKFLCPCSWFNLVLFATIDGRTEYAIQRARQWLDNGDSFSLLHMDAVLQEWSDRPEYQEIIDRNNEQVERQKALYFAGVEAREKSDAAQAASGF